MGVSGIVTGCTCGAEYRVLTTCHHYNSPVWYELIVRAGLWVCDLHLNKQLSKQSRRRWFDTSSRSLWRHCNDCHAWLQARPWRRCHYCDVIMGAVASQITSLTIVYSTVHSDADQRKLQSSASLAFVRGIHRGPVNSPHKWPVTRKIFPFDDVIMPYQSSDVMWHPWFWSLLLPRRLAII